MKTRIHLWKPLLWKNNNFSKQNLSRRQRQRQLTNSERQFSFVWSTILSWLKNFISTKNVWWEQIWFFQHTLPSDLFGPLCFKWKRQWELELVDSVDSVFYKWIEKQNVETRHLKLLSFNFQPKSVSKTSRLSRLKIESFFIISVTFIIILCLLYINLNLTSYLHCTHKDWAFFMRGEVKCKAVFSGKRGWTKFCFGARGYLTLGLRMRFCLFFSVNHQQKWIHIFQTSRERERDLYSSN